MRIFCESSFFGWTMNLLPVLYADVLIIGNDFGFVLFNYHKVNTSHIELSKTV